MLCLCVVCVCVGEHAYCVCEDVCVCEETNTMNRYRIISEHHMSEQAVVLSNKKKACNCSKCCTAKKRQVTISTFGEVAKRVYDM